jgi:hypothetical protein
MVAEKQLQILWDEYKYRHTHIWSTTYKITGAVVAICLVPYANQEILRELGRFSIVLHAVAIGLVISGWARLHRELKLFGKIKDQYRKLQTRDFDINHEEGVDWFVWHVLIYFFVLFLLVLYSALIQWPQWICDR